MSRKNWSNLFYLIAVLSIIFAAMVRFPLRVLVVVAASALILLALRTRKRMV